MLTLYASASLSLDWLFFVKLAQPFFQERSGSGIASILNRIETRESPPTYNETNKFTSVFQSIIDSYGVATYQEINPGILWQQAY